MLFVWKSFLFLFLILFQIIWFAWLHCTNRNFLHNFLESFLLSFLFQTRLRWKFNLFWDFRFQSFDFTAKNFLWTIFVWLNARDFFVKEISHLYVLLKNNWGEFFLVISTFKWIFVLRIRFKESLELKNSLFLNARIYGKFKNKLLWKTTFIVEE